MLTINDNHYFVKSLKISKSSFRKHLGLKPRSYMSHIANRLFEYYYANSTSLRREYRLYYKKEFETFNDYLMQKHNLLQSEIELLLHRKARYKDLTINSELYLDELMNDEAIHAAVTSFGKECST